MTPRVLILGGSGMLGHKLAQQFRERFETWTTLRQAPAAILARELYEGGRLVNGVDAFRLDSVKAAIDRVQPDVVVNCIGIVKQSAAASDAITTLTVNALFPHYLHRLCGESRTRLIHISTDCVFSGRSGRYSEESPADPEDLYGRTKLLGEVTAPDVLTIRTSMIGRELAGTSGLVEWFLSQHDHVRGYRGAVFSGFATIALAEVLAAIISNFPSLSGLFHVAAEPITKYDLLVLLARAFGRRLEIEPDDTIRIDRTLDGSHFQRATGLIAPSWEDMVNAMARDVTPYDTWRKRNDS